MIPIKGTPTYDALGSAARVAWYGRRYSRRCNGIVVRQIPPLISKKGVSIDYSGVTRVFAAATGDPPLGMAVECGIAADGRFAIAPEGG